MDMKLLLLILLPLLLAIPGCTSQGKQKADFSLTYFAIGQDNKTTQGSFNDSVSFQKNSIYFQIRANITNRDNVTHYLRVLEQSSGPYTTRLPLYSEETVNGILRDWRKLGWTQTMELPPAVDGNVSLVTFSPGQVKALEAPVFFFNQIVGPNLNQENELTIRIVDSNGEVLGEKTVTITVTG